MRSSTLRRWLAVVARAVGPVVAAVGLAVLLGWALRIEAITVIVPGAASMKVNTALALIALGAAFATLGPDASRPTTPRRGTVARLLALAVAALALATLAEYWLAVDLGIDEALVRDPTSGADPPGRMAPATALALAALAVAVIARTSAGGAGAPSRTARTVQAVAGLSTIALGVLALLGYTFGAAELTGAGALLRMAPHTSVSLAVLGVAVLAWQLPDGPLGTFVRETPGGHLARQTAAVGLVAVPAFGVARLIGEVAGLYEARFGLVVMVVGSAAIVAAFGLRVGRQLDAAQEQRAAAEARLRSSFDDAPIGQAIVSDDGRLLQVNQALCELLGADAADLVGRPFADVIHPADRETDVGARSALLGGEAGPLQAELRYRHRDGRDVWALRSVSLVRDEHGRPRYFHAQVQDVTARRRADEAVARLNRTLSQTNAELQEYASAVSHDLQAPLRRIQIFAERVADMIGERTDPVAADYVRRIHASAARLQVLVRDLLTYARLGQTPPTIGPVDLDEVLADAREDLSVEIDDAGATVEWADLPTIIGERAQLGQLFVNLIGNALKFRRPDVPSRVTISAHRTVGGDGTTPVWAIQVADNGGGFDPAFRDRIFRVFERLAADDVPGTGVGLAICRKVVERHGGWITADARPGEGATFTIELPAEPTPEAATAADADAGTPTR